MKFRFQFVMLFSLILVACNPAPESTVAPINKPITTAVSEAITIIFPTKSDGSEAYYLDLLQQSLLLAGYRAKFEFVEELPQKRAIEMLADGELTIYWQLQTTERDAQYVPIELDLTNNLIGHRVLLIPPGQDAAYSHVKTVDDFRALNKVGVFGEGWFDAKIWAENDLPYTEIDGEWRKIYGMLARGDRGFDYFSRGFNEIVAEAEDHPDLDIESHLLFVYDRDFRFYLSQQDAALKPVIENALLQAQASGLMDDLIQQYWGDDFDTLHYGERLKIQLDTPDS